MKFKYRGPNAFYFKRKRWPLPSLQNQMAWTRMTTPGGGGGCTEGDGEAWSKRSDKFGPWSLVRTFRNGQWVGPWRREKYEPPSPPAGPEEG